MSNQQSANKGAINKRSVPSGITNSKFRTLLKLSDMRFRLLSGFYAIWGSKRMRWALVFILVLVPIAKYFYLLFPEEGFGKYLVDWRGYRILNTIEGEKNDWYWYSLHFYLFSVGELLAPVLSTLGAFLLFPKKYYPAYILGIPFGYYLSMLIHRVFFVTGNDSFHAGAGTAMTLVFILLGIILFVLTDSIFFRQSLQKQGIEARIMGIVKMPGMSWQEKETLVSQELAILDQVDNELFIKEQPDPVYEKGQ